MKKKKAPPAGRTYMVVLAGQLEGFEATMSGPTTRDFILISSGEATTAQALQLIVSHVVDHNFAVDDVLDLEPWIILELLSAWSDAVKDAALPPELATS
jgi:hypothetical protein